MGTRRLRIRDVVIIGIIAGLFIFFMGFIAGSKASLDWCVETGFKFLEAEGINISIEGEDIYKLIWTYRKAVGNVNLEELQNETL